MVSLGLIFTGLAAIAGLIIVSRFGAPFGAGAIGIGQGLASLGGGIRSAISQVASPTIRPIIDFSQILPGLQAGLGAAGQVIQGRTGDGTNGTDDEIPIGTGGGGFIPTMRTGPTAGAGDLPPEYEIDAAFN